MFPCINLIDLRCSALLKYISSSSSTSTIGCELGVGVIASCTLSIPSSKLTLKFALQIHRNKDANVPHWMYHEYSIHQEASLYIHYLQKFQESHTVQASLTSTYDTCFEDLSLLTSRSYQISNLKFSFLMMSICMRFVSLL